MEQIDHAISIQLYNFIIENYPKNEIEKDARKKLELSLANK